MDPQLSYEVEPDDCPGETANMASTVQLFFQEANWQQPQNDIAESSDEGEPQDMDEAHYEVESDGCPEGEP